MTHRATLKSSRVAAVWLFTFQSRRASSVSSAFLRLHNEKFSCFGFYNSTTSKKVPHAMTKTSNLCCHSARLFVLRPIVSGPHLHAFAVCSHRPLFAARACSNEPHICWWVQGWRRRKPRVAALVVVMLRLRRESSEMKASIIIMYSPAVSTNGGAVKLYAKRHGIISACWADGNQPNWRAMDTNERHAKAQKCKFNKAGTARLRVNVFVAFVKSKLIAWWIAHGETWNSICCLPTLSLTQIDHPPGRVKISEKMAMRTFPSLSVRFSASSTHRQTRKLKGIDWFTS